VSKTKQIGPYVVKTLNVREGLHLLSLATEDYANELQTELILAAVSRDGNPIGDEDFSEMLPFMAELVGAAAELNGFSKKE
jgi:hypothetical protein